ncbi:C40 family peptidase [Leucobacter rhizosphaerae]|uniref:C40 family peptidase n=1 Tax=Leucobacter rhizosphaerae TaxID=2932245 RepID=A0ABY4FUI9_9MICO|nr:NlpC/P60 family protein [Leucobacter rhizosphaerae]UOQ59975.1 C40 family peptidase [Leucobacter rhizosphaerae]
MTQILSTEVVVSARSSKPASVKAKRFAQMAGAAALSLGMVGTFALPAYATTPDSSDVPDGFKTSQSIQTAEYSAEGSVVAAVEGSEDSAVAAEAAAEAKAAEDAKAAAEAQQAQAATTSAAHSGVDIPAGSGGAGIANAALAQLGVNQDCTALVEKSLRAVGIPAGDLGTQVGEYTALGGYIVTDGAYAPGDILVFPGQHVGVYIGNGQAVHGGWGGTTRIGPIAPGGESGLTVVRFG